VKKKLRTREAASGTHALARPLLLALVLFILVTVLAPVTAFAQITRPYEGSVGSFTREEPRIVEVDRSNGDIYVVNQSENSISRFDSTGIPKNFTAGPDAGTNTLTNVGFRPLSIAIDNSGGPLNGTIYVGAPLSNGIGIFSSTGEDLGGLTGSTLPDGSFGDPCGLTVDQSNGDLYIAQQGSPQLPAIWRYRPSLPSGSIEDADFTVAGIETERSCGDVAISSGQLYISDKYDSRMSKIPLSTFAPNLPSVARAEVPILEGVTGVDADPGTGEIYADQGNRITVVDPATDFPLYSFGANAYFRDSKGVAVKGASSGSAPKVYVADSLGQQVDVFGPAENAAVFSHLPLTAFGADGTSTSSFLTLDQLSFDQVARRLYALDNGASGIYGFDASSPPAYPVLPGFAPLGTVASGERSDLAVDSSSQGSAGNLFLASRATGLLYGFDDSGVSLGGAFPIDPATSPGAPNGSPKDICGAAVDSSGNIWASNSATKRILTYSSAGASLAGAIDTSAQGSPCRLAFDSADNLYATVGNDVWRYSAASSYTSATLIEKADRAVSITVDPSNDHLYVAHAGWVDHYDSAGKLVEEFAPGFEDSTTGVAVDATSGNVYLSDAKKVHVLGPPVLLPDLRITPASGITNNSANFSGTIGAQGLSVGECRFEYVTEAAFRASGFSDLSSGGSAPCSPAAASIPVDSDLHSVSATPGGLTRNQTYRFRLTATNANGTAVTSDLGFETGGPPLVETTGSPVRTTSTARLDGRVAPRGPAATYYFEYGDQGPCDSNPCTSTEPQSGGSGDVFKLVSQQIEGLEPSTTYHYRILADNGNPDGPAAGEDMTLTTFAEQAPLSHGQLPGPVGSDRAWEMVSAPETSGNPVGVTFAPGADTISDSGDRAVYGVAGGTPDSETGTSATRLFAQRTPTGWQTKKVYGPRGEATGAEWTSPGGPTDLSTMVTENNPGTGYGEFSFWRLSPDGPPTKLFSAPDKTTARGGFLATSDDGSRVLVTLVGSQDPDHPVEPPVEPNASSQQNLYDISSGSPRLVGLLPDGTVPACGVSQGATSTGLPNGSNRASRWVTADGSLAFFPARDRKGNSCGGPQRLYLRDFGTETSKSISSPTVSGALCDAYFIKSIPGAAFFYTQSRLVAKDAEPSGCGGGGGGSNGDVYRYDLDDGTLECVTCVVAGLDAGVTFSVNPVNLGEVIGIAEDGSRVYFTSRHRLLPGSPAKEGIYRLDVTSGELAYVGSFGFIGEYRSVMNASDGSVVVFASDSPSVNALGGQQNGGTFQYYRYDDNDRSLICVSCPLDGSLPKGDAARSEALRIPGQGANLTPLSVDGGIFAFTTTTALVPADQNTAGAGQEAQVGTDVYEWREGKLLLVSDGLTSWPPSRGGEVPEVAGMTPSGHDIFFVAAAQYTKDALDGYKRLYDARIGGGFEFPPAPKPCPLEVCQGTPKGAPEEAAPGTASITGVDNASRSGRIACAKPKRKVRRAGKTRCVKPSHKKAAHKRANHKRRTQR
jgi:hypothetical protein